MRPDDDFDDIPDTSDYGVFGDDNPVPVRPLTAYESACIRCSVRRKEREREVSSSFNRAMIESYNEARKRDRR